MRSSRCTLLLQMVCARSACLSVPTKTAELIEMTFEGMDSTGPIESCIRWGTASPQEKGLFGGSSLKPRQHGALQILYCIVL